MQSHSLVLSELIARLRWLVVLRWIAAGGIVIVTLTVRLLGGIGLPVAPLLIIAAAVAAMNAFFWLQLCRKSCAVTDSRCAVNRASTQIALDLVLLTLLLHFVGGVENPFYLYYVFHIIIASILLPAFATYLQATVALILFGGLVVLELIGLVPHVTIAPVSTAAYRDSGFVLAVLAAFGSTLYLAAYMATSIVGRLREREREVLALRDTLQAEQECLRLAYRQLQETEDAKARYMRTVGHQLRAPLAAVQTLLSTIIEGLAGPEQAETRDLVQRAQNRTREMLHLVDDLLALTRLRSVQVARVARPVALDDIARRVEDLFAAEAKAKGVTLETLLASLPSVQGDPVGLEDLLTNLVSNAIKYTPAGGSVRLSLTTEDGHVVVQVADAGIGIAPGELAHIFDEFYRSEPARAMIKEGTGLGLAIVRAVVEEHGGNITVESAPGKGTTFTVMLPVAHENSHQAPEGGRLDRPDDPSPEHDDRPLACLRHLSAEST